MGIFNATPDSFSDGGQFLDVDCAKKHLTEMVAQGADMLDIGGESTAPNSVAVSEEEEWSRIKDFLPHAVSLGVPVSVDTWKSSIARCALENGATFINDVTALRGDQDMANVLAKFSASVILMYSKDNSPRTTLSPYAYDDPLETIGDFLEERISYAVSAGIDPENIILDPGMGAFLSSDPAVSFEVLSRLSELKVRFPEQSLLVGTSRKGFLCPNRPPQKRLIASVVSGVFAAERGADILRVHDVSETREALSVLSQFSSFPLFYRGENSNFLQSVFLGLGSNLGNREANIQEAIQLISHFVAVKKISSVYETAPWGKEDQPSFLNAVVETEIPKSSPEEFLKKLQEIEKKIGRQKREKWGPREIDVDILFWGNKKIKSDTLTIPHPYWKERDFVLKPLREIAPNFIKKSSFCHCGLDPQSLNTDPESSLG